ncbi:MAG: D-glycero-beta-D-manno-heptose 1-phosphate adenylyltransferase [Bacteroidetes bacterium]|nr:D-glycero-beta-D-manno-heptose 1-phosphate adenylyltransferase [Bacteroidota bacterium]
MSRLQWIENKIMTLDALVHHCNQWKAIGKKIVFTNGCFDILHRGHLDYLAKAADLGNIMIIGLNTDASVKRLKGQGRPVNNEYDRAFQLGALMYVDAVCLFDEDTPAELIIAVKPHVLVKGGDYTVETIVGADTVLSNGGRVEVIPFVEGYSTSTVINNIKKL